MPITKAVIAAGGWSTRFLPAVKVYAKQLVPILDKPQIQWVMEELVGAGITNFAIVHRESEETLKQFFAPNAELDTYLKSTGKESAMDSYNVLTSKIKSLQFLPQTKAFPYGNGTPILVAKDFIGSDPFIYLWGDDMTIEAVPGTFLHGAISLFEQYSPAAVECVQAVPWEQVYRYGTVKYQDDPQYPHRISGLFEKLPQDQAPSNIIQGGRFVVSPKIIDVLEHTAVAKGELWFADAINSLCQSDVVITHNYTENNAEWSTTGDPQNWLKTIITLALKNENYASIVNQALADSH